jgi:dUTP pyrophosphatase
MKLKYVRLTDSAIAPSKTRDSDAGFDLFATENYFLKAHERKLFSTDLALEIPNGYEGHIRDRSGKALKLGLHVLGGQIDSEFRGPIGVILYNTNPFGYIFYYDDKYITGCRIDDECNGIQINKGDKIAQIVINELPYFETEEVQSLDNTDRGSRGYGSSGI